MRSSRLIGRSDRVRTCGLNIPNVARYQLRYTPIVIKLWSCKWSNLWSNTFLTAIFCFPNRPKYARLKGFRRFSLSCGANTVYAPKAGALPTALHPDIFDFLLFQSCEFRYNNPLRFPQKHSRTARLERVALLVVFSPQSFAQLRYTPLYLIFYFVNPVNFDITIRCLHENVLNSG